MQKSRLFGILTILIDQKKVTAKELAERFEVSVRTIYRDIEALSAAGIPVFAMQGNGGGIGISETYMLSNALLTDAEQTDILLALRTLSVTDDTNASGLLQRLSSVFEKQEDSWIEVDFSSWGQPANGRDVLAVLKEAIVAGKQVRFCYYAASGEITQRTVCPVKLQYKTRAWYVQAFDPAKQGYRVFKLLRMNSVQITTTCFDKHLLPEVPVIAEQWAAAQRYIQVRVQVAAAAIWRMWDMFEIIAFWVQKDGSVEAEIRIADDEWLPRMLLSFGAAMRVLAPESVQQRIQQEMHAIAKRYEKEEPWV